MYILLTLTIISPLKMHFLFPLHHFLSPYFYVPTAEISFLQKLGPQSRETLSLREKEQRSIPRMRHRRQYLRRRSSCLSRVQGYRIRRPTHLLRDPVDGEILEIRGIHRSDITLAEITAIIEKVEIVCKRCRLVWLNFFPRTFN